jgi:hypothetical protein
MHVAPACAGSGEGSDHSWTETKNSLSYLDTLFQILMDGAYWWRSFSSNQRA